MIWPKARWKLASYESSFKYFMLMSYASNCLRIRVLRQHTRHCWKHAILGQIWGVRVEPILEFFIYFCLFSGGSVGLLLSKEWRCKILMKIEEFVRIVQLSVQWYYTKHPIVQILVKSKQNQNQSQLRFVKMLHNKLEEIPNVSRYDFYHYLGNVHKWCWRGQKVENPA